MEIIQNRAGEEGEKWSHPWEKIRLVSWKGGD
jgi:hypothetical protein